MLKNVVSQQLIELGLSFVGSVGYWLQIVSMKTYEQPLGFESWEEFSDVIEIVETRLIRQLK